MSIHLNRWIVPITLLILLILIFGIFFPWLGFYWDDWPVLLTGQMQGISGYWDFYQYDRPISAWTYWVTFPLLGTTPWHWQVFSLLLRWGTAAAFWWTMIGVWPAHRRQATWVALLFAVYPVFTQQFVSVAYSQHWICYLLYFLSLGVMVAAWRSQRAHPRRAWMLTGLGMTASLLQLLTMEYFAGLELLRPLFLWVLASEQVTNRQEKVRLVLRSWLPYLLVLVGFTIWRLFFLEFPGEEANSPKLLIRMLSDPFNAGLRFIQIAMQDTLHLLISVWANTVSPQTVNLFDRFNLFSWAWAILIAAMAALSLSRVQEIGPDQANSKPGWTRQALVIGGTAIALGMLPVWFTDRQIIVGMYSNRFALPAMLGISLVLVALVEWVIAQPIQRLVLVSLLIGLAAGAHMRTANEYRWVRVLQNRLFWQIAWRAPGIEPRTAIMAPEEILSKTGLYSTAAGINLIYAAPSPTGNLPYWFYSLSDEFSHLMPELTGGMPLETSFRNFLFEGDSHDSLIIYFQPGDADCMRVITPSDALDPALPAVVTQALPIINLARIQANPAQVHIPDAMIFGPEPERGWCFLFQKADLARQIGDWDEVSRLGDLASEKGYTMQNLQSNTPQEWVPFIEGYAHVGRWGEAVDLSGAVLDKEPKMAARLCSLWKDIAAAVPETSEQTTVQNLLSEAGCGQ